MNIDSDTHASSSGSMSALFPARIPNDDKDKLNDRMKAICEKYFWRTLMAVASDDSDFKRLFSYIVFHPL